MAHAEWMWSDADIMGVGFGRMNRMVWSSKKSLEDTRTELQNVSLKSRIQLQRSENLNRPISLKSRWSGITLKQESDNIDSAIAALASIAEVLFEDKENETDTFTVDCALRMYAGLFETDANVAVTSVRWMWNDAGLSNVVSAYATLAKKNPLRWSGWMNVAGALEALEAIAKAVSEARSVKLEVSGSTHGGSAILMEVRCSAVHEAVDVLLGLITDQCEVSVTRGRTRKSIGGCTSRSVHKSRASSVEEVFFFPLELEQAVEDAEQVLRNAEQRSQRVSAENQAQEVAQHQRNAELAEMLERTTRQRKVRTEMLAEVARNLQEEVVEHLPSVDRNRKRCKSLGEALEDAVERRTRRMRQA